MKTYFIRKQIDTGMHDIMYQVSKQLDGIAKPMVHNRFQQAPSIWRLLEPISVTIKSPTLHKYMETKTKHILLIKYSWLLHP